MTDVVQMIDAVFSGRVGGFYTVIEGMLALAAIIMAVQVVKKGIRLILSQMVARNSGGSSEEAAFKVEMDRRYDAFHAEQKRLNPDDYRN
jgi:hypothetical protein